MKKITLNEWLEMSEKAMLRAWFPYTLEPGMIRAISSSLLATFCNLLSENGYIIAKREASDE